MTSIDGMIEIVRRGFAPDASPEAKAEAGKVLRAGLALLGDAPAPSSAAAAPAAAAAPPDMLGSLVATLMGMLPEWKQREVQAQVAADIPFVGGFGKA